MFWKRKKYIFIIEPKKRETKKTKGRFVKLRSVVFIVVGVFVVISSVEYEKHKLKRKQAALDIMRLREIAEKYIWEHGKCPEDIDALVSTEERKKRNIEDITDPWGRKYGFICPGKSNRNSADIISAGPDRSYYTIDDVKIN